MQLKLAFITSYPMDVRIGSGVIRMIQGFNDAFNQLGHDSRIIHPDYFETDPRRLADLRLSFNQQISRNSFDEFDAIIGSDFDGFALEVSSEKYYVLSGGILADIVRFEEAPDAQLLIKYAELEKRNFKKAGIVITPSRYAAGRLIELYGVPASNILVAPLGIDLSLWRECLARASPQPERETRFLCVARQYRRKGIRDLLQAFRLAHKRVPGARLTLVGDGPECKANRQLAAVIGIQQLVDFAGDIGDLAWLAGYYENADVFCLPSYHETFGLVFLEAMAAGLPIITYRSTAIPEVVTEAEGLLCEPGDIDQLAGRMIHLCENRETARLLGNNGQRRAEEFSWERAAGIIAAAIQSGWK
jgi:glycosyltransferase involved in cell wall biosynthesis